MRTAKETFYFVEDVMKMLGLSRSKAYSIIKQFNSELEEQGYPATRRFFCWLIGVAVNLVSVAGIVVTFFWTTNVSHSLSVSYFRSWPVGVPRCICPAWKI